MHQGESYAITIHHEPRSHTHTHKDTVRVTHTHQSVLNGKRWFLSIDLKDEADWENLMSFGSMFQRNERERVSAARLSFFPMRAGPT